MMHAHYPHTSLKAMQSALESATKLVAFAATVCIALSVLFDWGYMSALDLRLSEVPTSLSDHTRSAILWLPIAGFFLLIGFVVSLFFDECDARAAVEAENRGEDLLVYAANETKQARRNLAVIAVISVALWLALGDRSRLFLFVAATVFWVLIVIHVTSMTDRNRRVSTLLRLGLVLPPILAGSLYSLGYNAGHAAIAPDQTLGMLVVRGGTGTEIIKGNIVRPFERFVVVIDENQKIVLIKPDDVLRVEKAGYVSSNRGLLCEYWKFACPRLLSHAP